MLFAGDRDIIGFLQSYPPKPIYGKGNEIAYDPDLGDTFGSDDADLNWAIPDPDRPTIFGSDVLDLLIQNEQVMKPGQSPGDDRSKDPYDKDWPAPAPLAPKSLLAANPSFDIGSGHKGANKAAKIYNKIRANDNMNEVETIRRILGGPSLPTF